MKTAKEKAIELVDTFEYAKKYSNVKNSMSFELAKQCAIICVNEIMLAIDKDMQGFLDADIISYYKQVKTEIEKL